MKKPDARKLSSEVQEGKRKQAIRLHKKGKRYKEIAELLEVHFETVGKWVRAYRVNGMKALSSNVRGRRRGSSRKLTPEHEDIIQGLIIDKTPDQLKMVYALWTRKAVLELIENKLGVKLSIRTLGNYLRSWGFSPKKPLKGTSKNTPVLGIIAEPRQTSVPACNLAFSISITVLNNSKSWVIRYPS